jgi:hypothetical protein
VTQKGIPKEFQRRIPQEVALEVKRTGTRVHWQDIIVIMRGLDELREREKREQYDRGKARMRAKHADLSDAARLLRQTRDFLGGVVSWQGLLRPRGRRLRRARRGRRGRGR